MRVKSLLIVYKEKDESFFKKLKDLIVAKDDDLDSTIGVEDGTVRPIKCSEKKWLEHKESGRDDKLLGDKILFIDDIKDITLSNPVYNKYGISYGSIDQRHYAIVVDEKYAWNELDYTSFQLELKQLTDNANISETDVFSEQTGAKKRIRDKGKLAVLGLLFPPALIVAGGMAIKDASDIKKNSQLLRSQMLYFAITKVYLEELDKFIKK